MGGSEIEAKVVDLDVETEKNSVIDMRINVDGSVLGANSRKKKERYVKESKDKEGEKTWVEISPGKSSRTPIKSTHLEFGHVSILSKSRFSVLSMEEEEGEINEEHGENEEVSKEDDKESELEESILQKEEERVHLRQYLPRGSKNKQ